MNVLPWKPTQAQLAAAVGGTLKDLIAPHLKVLFCGINPGLYSAAIGHHFGRPGNRFWPALHTGGFTGRLLSPFEEQEVLKHGYGLTNLVSRATASAAELTDTELRAGGRRLLSKIERYHPRLVAFLGITSFRCAFRQPDAKLGRQSERLAGAIAWVLPSPSGLNAHHRPRDLARLFTELRLAIEEKNK